MKNKIFFAIAIAALISAGCNPFATTIPTGIIKSTNGGVNWEFQNTLASSTTVSLASASIAKLAFDPNTHTTLFAGSYTGGMYESQDSGASWENILSKIYVYDFAVDPTNSKIIYAAGFFDNHGRVLKTIDGGGSWNQIYNEESAANPVRAIALNPADTSEVVIGTAGGTVIKSGDGGQTWQLLQNFNDQVNRVLWQDNIYVLLKSKGLFKSSGLNSDFTEVTTSLGKTYNLGLVSYSSVSINTFSQVYVDQTTPTLMYLTTDQGLFKTVDGGTTWVQQKLPVNPGAGQARAITVSPGSSNIIYTSIGATMYKSLDGGTSWQTQGVSVGGFVNYILLDPQYPQIVYAGVYNTQ